MIYPMMLKVDFTELGGIARKPKGLVVKLMVNWLVKPFSMALLAWFSCNTLSVRGFHRTGEEYTAGLIMLAAGLAMVFVWSYLTVGSDTRSCRWR
jgi:ACR3 family arsenite transporter